MSQMTLICYSSYNQSKQTFQKYFWIWNPETAHNIWPSVFSSTFFSHGWMACNGKSKVLFFGAHYRQCCLCSKSSWKRAKNNNIRLPVTVRAWLKKLFLGCIFFGPEMPKRFTTQATQNNFSRVSLMLRKRQHEGHTSWWVLQPGHISIHIASVSLVQTVFYVRDKPLN